MKTQTAEDITVKNPFTDENNDNLSDLIKQHTTTQIEALRERLSDVPEFFSYTDEIDKVFNAFLKEINDK